MATVNLIMRLPYSSTVVYCHEFDDVALCGGWNCRPYRLFDAQKAENEDYFSFNVSYALCHC